MTRVFPLSPSISQKLTLGSKEFEWDGNFWKRVRLTESDVSASVSSATTDANSYTDTAIANLVNTAPSTLDTLNELAAALGDDPNFATTISNQLANKANLSGATFTGDVTSNGVFVSNELRNRTGQQLILNAGESAGQATGQTGEYVYINGETGLEVNASPDNWGTGWAGRRTTRITANGAYTEYSLPTSRTWRPITISTGTPSGGTNGDVWIQY